MVILEEKEWVSALKENQFTKLKENNCQKNHWCTETDFYKQR